MDDRGRLAQSLKQKPTRHATARRLRAPAWPATDSRALRCARRWISVLVELKVPRGAGASGTRATPSGFGTGQPNEEDDLFRIGFTGGGQAGYNWQFAPSWVAGVESDIGILSTKRDLCDINGYLPGGAFSLTLSS
jgi:hypothetical protein